MAIYKPSNCVPFLSCLDLTKKQYISCELNTSNRTVDGYKIRILNNNNDEIFVGSRISEIPTSIITDGVAYSNTGLNGSTLTLPMVEVENDVTKYTNFNVIYFDETDQKWYKMVALDDLKIGREEITGFTNGNTKQPYKWIITLYQGFEEVGKMTEADIKFNFDMNVDTGKILGSTSNRIQSYLSEYIYKDYYIQLYDANDKQLGSRTRISSYDHSYGFVYPQENTLAQNLVDKAASFRVFKDTNDPQYVSTARIVNMRLKSDINSVKLKDKVSGELKSPISEFGPTTSVETNQNPYFEQIYEGDVRESITYSNYGGIGEQQLPANATVLLMYQGANGTNLSKDPGTYNAYNGVFAFQSATYDGDNKETTIKWLRPANFNTYANFIERSIFISNESMNYNTSAKSGDVSGINQTGLMFYPEAPIGLYPVYNEDKTVKEEIVNGTEFSTVETFGEGVISSIRVISPLEGVTAESLGSNKYIVTKNTTSEAIEYTLGISYMEDKAEVFHNIYDGVTRKGRAYIKPFVGIKNKDLLFRGENNQYISEIVYVDNEPNFDNKFSPTWYVDYTNLFEDNNEALVLDTEYSIRTNKKDSDENPFYAQNNPELRIDSSQWEKDEGGQYGYVENTTYYKGVKRYITVVGTIENRNWVNYQWILTDLTMGYVQRSDKIYRGATNFTFFGLENEHYYEIEWIVEDEYGMMWSVSEIFVVLVSINDTQFPFNVKYECETQSVLIDFVRDGVVIPSPSIYGYDHYYVHDELIPANYVPYMVVNKNGTLELVQRDIYSVDNGAKTELGYNISYSDGRMVLSDVFDTADIDKIKQLIAYTQTKLGETDSERGEISVPIDKDCTLNSQHILNNNFCGEIISYQIDVENVNYQKSYIVLTLYVPTPWYQDGNGKYVENPDRNKLKMSIFKQVGGVKTNIADVKLNLYRKGMSGAWELDESGVWSPVKSDIVSAWVNPKRLADGTLISNGVDYIETTDVYQNGEIYKDADGKTYQNIIGEGKYNSNGQTEIRWPINKGQTTGEYYHLWLDKKYKSIPQYHDGEYINVEIEEYNYWPSEAEEAEYYWNDTNSDTELYQQVLTTAYTSRGNLDKTRLTVNIVIKDFSSSEIQKTEQLVQNIIANIFIEEIGGGN